MSDCQHVRPAPAAGLVDIALMAIARLSLVVLDCPDPWSLAPFYERLTGMKKTSAPRYQVFADPVGHPFCLCAS